MKYTVLTTISEKRTSTLGELTDPNSGLHGHSRGPPLKEHTECTTHFTWQLMEVSWSTNPSLALL